MLKMSLQVNREGEKRKMEFGEKIKHLREDRGMTQQTIIFL